MDKLCHQHPQWTIHYCRDLINSFLELENESKFCHVNDECSDTISLLLENNPLYCDCNMQQVRDQHEKIFADLEITQCVNQDITVFEFHDELCCDINNID